MKHQALIFFKFFCGAMGRLQMPFAIVMLLLILNLPTSMADLQVKSFIKLQIELLVIVLFLAGVGARYFKAARLAVTIILSLVLLLKLADIATYAAFSRQFNPLFDLKLLFDGWNVLTATIGLVEAWILASLIFLCFVFFIVLVYWSLGSFRDTRIAIPLALGVLISLAIAFSYPGNGWIETRTSELVVDRVAIVQKSLRDKQAFEALLERDTASDVPLDQRFDALQGKDIIVVFIESYGESVVRDPRYSNLISKRLANVEQQISVAGLTSKSSWLLSPTSGGLSWLAHGTLLSGVWVDSQQRYTQLIESKRPSLNRLFQEAGWRSVAVMPAITMDWPEGNYFGYDTVYAANNLGYKGKPFNWVTMPDQYTLSAFQNLERNGPHKPLMAEIALISSHAPWTPIPHLVDWLEVGDGTIFNAQAIAGESPEIVWQDHERVRAQYAASIDYALETLGSYMARYGRNTVFILLGDHQPAPIITGNNASRAVPIHIVSDDSALLERLDSKKWNRGMMPETQTAEPMDGFRQELLRKFSSKN
ncbi:sulfatase-like hydrolase/transferase [Phyllobacterium sp. YR531]|uniref:sulfatase-like hydrolase/transferase n=1 Tax=Phyllobacterium sp. YR531 TaxID=1144343 RepID=UPI00026FA18D|nr:sulfatase-like hydrolase/transferase [Phyllobacterium sp. YR531]EJN02236.1 phosphoglycerol transferase family protein, alkaline phosphatase superfamily [Phyllobacterium sp. YR531]